MRFGEEEQSEETRTQRTDEEDVRGGGPTEESGGLVEGEIRGVSRTRLAEKEKDKATEDKENTERKEDLEVREQGRT